MVKIVMINYLYRKNVVNIKVKIPKNKLIYYSFWWSDKFNGNDSFILQWCFHRNLYCIHVWTILIIMTNSNKPQVGGSYGRTVSVSFELLFLVNEDTFLFSTISCWTPHTYTSRFQLKFHSLHLLFFIIVSLRNVWCKIVHSFIELFA